VRMACETLVMGDPDAAQPDVISLAETVDVEACTGPVLHLFGGRDQTLCQGEVLLIGQLDVARAAGDERDLQPCPFRDRGLIREIRSALGMRCMMRIEDLLVTKALRGLCAPEALA